MIPILLAATLLFPQAAPERVLFDFEGGNYEGWTLEGTAFGAAPASDKTFAGQITGFSGKGFVCTLDPKLGAKTLGKATSKEFTIDKPFLEFKIGGGRHPKEACLNLVVDGKIVRTETGNDSPNLSLAYWDVYEYVGKKAHLEIVDATSSPNRGYVMVDNIGLATHEGLQDEDMPALTPSLVRHFANTIRDFRVRKGVYAEYGISQAEFISLANRITAQVIKPTFDHNPNLSVEHRAKSIRDAVVLEIERSLPGTQKPVLVERMVLQGLHDWIRTHFHYSQYLAKDGVPREVRSPFWEPKYLIAMAAPKGVCAGYGNTLVAMGKACGLDCFPVNGFARRWFDSSKLPEDPLGPSHKWVIMRQSDGLLVPADPTNSSIDLKVARQLPVDKWTASSTLPVTPEDWAVYAAVYYASISSQTGKAIPETQQISALAYGEWKAIGVSSLKARYSQYTGTKHWASCLVD